MAKRVRLSATNPKPFQNSTVTGSVSFVGNRPETSEHMEHAAAAQRGTKKTTTSCKAHHDDPRVQHRQAGVTSGLLCSGFLTLSSFTWLWSQLWREAEIDRLVCALYIACTAEHRGYRTGKQGGAVCEQIPCGPGKGIVCRALTMIHGFSLSLHANEARC